MMIPVEMLVALMAQFHSKVVEVPSVMGTLVCNEVVDTQTMYSYMAPGALYIATRCFMYIKATERT